MAELPARRRLREKQEAEAAAAAAAASTGGASSAGDSASAGAGGGGRGSEERDDAFFDYGDDGGPAGAGGGGTDDRGSYDGGGDGGDAYYDVSAETGRSTDTAAERNRDAWKTFGSDTPAGRLLKKLYGDQSKPQIKYPKVKQMDDTGHARPFVPGGGKHGVDARTTTRVAGAHVAVPRMNGGRKGYHLTQIEYHEMAGGRRKPQDAIKAELDQAEQQRMQYRPPATKATATALEKRRLQTINTLKGGKALPEELTLRPIDGNIPLSMMSEKPIRRRGKPKARPKPKSTLQLMFDETVKEIDERVEFLNEMRKLGQAKQHEASVGKEIADRTRELEKLNKLLEEEAAGGGGGGSGGGASATASGSSGGAAGGGAGAS